MDGTRRRRGHLGQDPFHYSSGAALAAQLCDNLPRSEALPAYRQGGRDIVSSVLHWIAEGLIDTVSGGAFRSW
jgi:hypothetical protein